ncbi:Uma2 family endonuclease [Hydrogenivirga sp. 128-5-R1-1]|uniref:Uma2 family endonuclease n=1 Tax=Hydrogenivirga sp. 128-5-R1-1 TaxID=392423 RepID=UPI00015EF191|nr:Uma2 family endonuclease [Hydrogenivirga sp. 128-5-R1-1]EDP74713.1 hypothetical protein HG1285_14914 [Hydrogenivirga sp. 128-5-R1-1]
MGLAERFLPHYTVRDYERWEGDWELIEGIPYALASPSPLHQRTLARLVRLFDEKLDACPECNVYVELDWYVSEDTVVRPDMVVVCSEKPFDKLTFAPDMAVEVVSPSTRDKDEELKRMLYEKKGLRWYVLVYPEDKKVKVFTLSEGFFSFVTPHPENIFEFDLGRCKVSVDFREVFTN